MLLSVPIRYLVFEEDARLGNPSLAPFGRLSDSSDGYLDFLRS